MNKYSTYGTFKLGYTGKASRLRATPSVEKRGQLTRPAYANDTGGSWEIHSLNSLTLLL